MRIQMKIELSGARDGVKWPGIGSEVDLPDDEAAQMCANGYAAPVAERAEPETAASRHRAESRAKD